MITIVDYGAGNLRSVARAFEYLNIPAQVADRPETVDRAEAVVFPGVGAAGAAMRFLKEKGLDEAVSNALKRGIPFLGVCLGMQLLLASHEEGNVDGLALLPGRVRRLPDSVLVPQMGWNQVTLLRESKLFDGIPPGAHFYFNHSYYAEPSNREMIAGQTDYGLPFCSVIEAGNLWGVQFHPEKSSVNGLKLLSNFAREAGVRERPTGARGATPGSGPRGEAENAKTWFSQGPLPEGAVQHSGPEASQC